MDNLLIDKLKAILEKNKNILFAYIFGSFVKGNRIKGSDIDFAIYTFEKGMDTTEYLNLKRELMDTALSEVDIVILNHANPLIKHEIFRDGIRLFSRHRDLESNFIVHSLFEYEDMKKYYDLSYESMISRIRKEVKKHV